MRDGGCVVHGEEAVPAARRRESRPPLVIAIVMQVFQQFTGINFLLRLCPGVCLSDESFLLSQRIAEAVGDWFYGRGGFQKTDCPYPCDSTCYTN
ncbi:hypothetical protein ZWY2020_021850 [Hordeum vulgare]|nr:hypothetical protein ZWY2020_021850 [Hordeum vulgare]